MIDSLKEKMSDEVYLALCEKMKELHTEQQQDEDSKKIPVRIWFMNAGTYYVRAEQSSTGHICETYKVSTVQMNVMMYRSELDKLKSDIEDSETHAGNWSFNDPDNFDLYEAPEVGRLECFHEREVNVYKVEEI
jgi:hypothetical protein